MSAILQRFYLWLSSGDKYETVCFMGTFVTYFPIDATDWFRDKVKAKLLNTDFQGMYSPNHFIARLDATR